jgi:N-acetylglucosaminyldiphosphoundecaprenol N-acetyl-beta-D-mannosaminyltransferase
LADDEFIMNSVKTRESERNRDQPFPVPERANVLGIGVHAVDLSRSAEMIGAAADTNRKGYVCVTGIHGVMEAQQNIALRKALDHAMLVVPDGVPTVWVGRLQGHNQMERVFGPDLMKEVCRRSVAAGQTHFLYGGNPGVAEQLKGNLESLFPGIRIVGTYTPPFRPLSIIERSELEARLFEGRPDFFWVGLSTPKQELFMAENFDALNCKIMLGVGAAFDIHTGRIKDAPDWVKRSGLQWFHRLCQEPSRLWKRYLVSNTGFLVRIVLQFTGLKRYELSGRDDPSPAPGVTDSPSTL